jgi:uncharacterized protein YjlB
MPIEVFAHAELTVAWLRPLPLVTYHGVIADTKVELRALAKGNGWRLKDWSGRRLDGGLHFHSMSHEIVLCINGMVLFEFEHGERELAPGMAWAIPAGMVHRCVHQGDRNVLARLYTGEWDLVPHPSLRPVDCGYALPIADPFYGDRGPLSVIWQQVPWWR